MQRQFQLFSVACLYLEVCKNIVLTYVCIHCIVVGLGRMANKEYRRFLMCLINAQCRKGSFTHHNVRMCNDYVYACINAYSKFYCIQAVQSGINKYDFEMSHYPVSFSHSDATIK